MYKVMKECEQIALIENPIYIKCLSDGTFTPATEADCQGIAVDSVPYNLFGCNPMDGVTETVVLCECDGGIELINHSQSASTITDGTFAGQVVANEEATSDLSMAQVRNIYAGAEDMVAGTSSLATGTLYFVYE